MRVIRLGPIRGRQLRSLAAAGVMLALGAASAALLITGPRGRPDALAILSVAALLGLGVGTAILVDTARSRTRQGNEDLVQLLAPTLTDAYLLILDPRLPGVSSDVAAILVGPPGVRALLARRWHGHYRVHGRRWEYNTHGASGWVRCITDPSWEAAIARNAVAEWARVAADETHLPLEAAIVFPSPETQLGLEEPGDEIITVDNAPWWAQRIGKAQRMDAARVVRFAEAVVAARGAHSAPARSAETT